VALLQGYRKTPDRAAWQVHEHRASSLVADLLTGLASADAFTGAGQARSRAAVAALFQQPADVAGSVLMLLVRAASQKPLPWGVRRDLNNLRRRRWTVTREDTMLAARTAIGCGDSWQAGWALKLVEMMLSRAAEAAPLSGPEAELVSRLMASVDRRRMLPPGERNQLRSRLVRLLPRLPAQTVDTSAIAPVDGWAAAVLPGLQATDQPLTVNALLRHLTDAAGSKPTPKWLAGTAELVADPDVVDVIRFLLEQLVDADPKPAVSSAFGVRLPYVLADQNIDVARALVWATIPVAQPWVVPALQRLITSCLRSAQFLGGWSGEKVPNAGILVLGQIATPEAVVALQQLAGSTKNNGFRKRIAAALATAADTAGLLPSQLVERTVSRARLNGDGRGVWTSGDLTAAVEIDARLRVVTRWESANGWTAGVPAGAAEASVKAIKRAVKEAKDGLAGERRRLEGILASDRSWELDQWQRYYLDHPITGRLTRRLIWVFEAGGERLIGIPGETQGLQTCDGEVALPSQGVVRLWHPANATTDEVLGWRNWLLGKEFLQPFKQAFREVYLITPAERETATYSNRFAAHVLRYQQLYALLKARDWVTNYLGPYDGGYVGRARREFPDAGLTAVFEHGQIDQPGGALQVEFCTTDRVGFYRTSDRAKRPVAVDDVPPLVFTETMRDVDLFVAVTTIALDPTWADRGDDPLFHYWQSASSGALSTTADVRRDVLATLLPKLKIADRIELLDRYVRVRGQLATYKIHIGSANILIEPDDRYLCIVPASAGRGRSLMLPFEGDDVLTVILSKVIMLAADEKITDRSIVGQIARR
jgi:hypothetical protein